MTVADFCLVSNNCTVYFVHVLLDDLLGSVYHTPWVGMQIPDDEEFVRLCLHYDEYMALDPVMVPSQERRWPCMSQSENTPVMHLGNTEIHWVHETDPNKARETFLRRRDRSRGKMPFFFWSDYQRLQGNSEVECEPLTQAFLSLPDHQRLYVRKQEIPAWRLCTFTHRTLPGVHGNILGWPGALTYNSIIADYLRVYSYGE